MSQYDGGNIPNLHWGRFKGDEVDSKNTLWVGTNTGGLNKFNSVNKTFKNYTYDPLKPKECISGITIIGIAEDSTGKLWLSTYADGYDLFDPATGKAIQYYRTKEHPEYPSQGPVFNISYDKKRKCIWLGTFSYGLVKMDLATHKIEKHMHSDADPNSISSNTVSCIKEDENGILWLGTLGGGLASYDPEKDKFRNWKPDASKKYSMANINVNSLAFEKNRIWFATDIGVHIFDKKTEHFRQIAKKDGLPDDLINSVELDNKGNAWVATNRGLSCIMKPKDGFIIEKNSLEQPLVIKNFDPLDGIQGFEFNGTSFYKDKNGNLYFGGMNGFTIVHPDLIEENHFIPSIYLTDFKLFNKSIEPNDSLHLFDKYITFAKEVNLNYKQNFFSISFTAFNYKNPEKIIYQYKLEGFDEDWVTVGSDKRFATYTNLDPGNYTFRARASIDGIHWSTKEATVDVIISPPFWQTIPFRGAVIIAFALMIAGIARYIFQRNFRKKLALFERQEEISRIRGRIARDIHDNIGAELTRISLLTEVAQIENRDVKSESLNKLSDASREITGQLGEIVWSVNPSHDNLKSMLGYIRNYISNFLENANVHYEIDLPEEVEDKIIHPEMRRNLFLVLKEALNNSIKYSKAKNIMVSLLIMGDNYVLKIVDDGIGMDMSIRKEGNGLMNMQNRMDTIAGDLHIISFPGKGTSVIAEGKIY